MGDWQHPDTWRIRARLRGIALLVAVLVVVAAWGAIESHGRALALFVHAMLPAPGEPLAWVTAPPLEEALHWPDGGEGLLTLPGTADPHAALLVVLGAEPADPHDPAVVRLREGLARIGVASLIARSHPLIDGRVTPDEVPLIVGGFEALERDRRVRAGRVGMLGLSTGGSLVIVAAAEPAIARRVRSVIAIGAYDHASQLVAEVVAGAYRTPAGRIEAWTPDETSVRVVRATLLAALSPGDRSPLEAGGGPPTGDARIALELMQTRSLGEAEALVGTLGASVQEYMRAISPGAHLQNLRAPLFLLHDLDDAFIPVVHTQALMRDAAPRAATLVGLFEHVEPRPADVRLLLRDGWRVLHLLAQVIRSL